MTPLPFVKKGLLRADHFAVMAFYVFIGYIIDLTFLGAFFSTPFASGTGSARLRSNGVATAVEVTAINFRLPS